MSSPKHLWSGDWQDDSAAMAEELARRRGAPTLEAPPTPKPAPTPRRVRARPTARLARPAWLHQALLIALGVLVIAGAAYGLTQVFASGGSQPASANAVTPWLGVDMESLPVNRVVVAAVVPGGPADAAGLGPGDLITAVNRHAIMVPGDVTAAIARLHPGDRVAVQIQRGGATFTTRVSVAARPAGYP
jgi:membrane-associated protease RseP (regulator of RpoE activity)